MNGREISETNLRPASKEIPAGIENPAIQAKDFSLSYENPRGGEEVAALKGLDFSISRGEIVTVVGSSGCGKTSLLRAIGGLLTGQSETVRISGELQVFQQNPEITRKSRGFAFAFQSPALLPWRTTRENVRLPLEIMRSPMEEADRRVNSILEMVGIQEFASSLPDELSGGMRQRANLARALIQNPKVLLMDEPFGSLDEVTRERLNTQLLSIHRREKFTIVFVTHNITEAVLLGDKVLILSRRPARVSKQIRVPLPEDRPLGLRFSPDFLDIVREVRQTLVNTGDTN